MSRRKSTWGILSVVAVLVIVGIVVGTQLLAKTKPHVSTPATSTVSLAKIASIFERYSISYFEVVNPANATIVATAADITKQNERFQQDETTYATDDFGLGCTTPRTYQGEAITQVTDDFNAYESCMSTEENTALSALSDKIAATAASNTDATREVVSLQRIQAAAWVYIQQLDSVQWPKVARNVASLLEQDLNNYKDALAQCATDLADGQNISADNSTITTDFSNIGTQLVNMDNALKIPPPAPSTTAVS